MSGRWGEPGWANQFNLAAQATTHDARETDQSGAEKGQRAGFWNLWGAAAWYASPAVRAVHSAYPTAARDVVEAFKADVYDEFVAQRVIREIRDDIAERKSDRG